MRKVWEAAWWFLKIVCGCAAFSLGFNLFLGPHGMNAGGIAGLAMVLVHIFNIGTVGLVTLGMNFILFIVAGTKIGKKFFFGSLVGAGAISVTLDLLSVVPVPQTDPLLAALYGGAICGLGLGLVISTGASTGGSDIIIRLLKRKWPNVRIGVINICFDMMVAALTGIVYGNITLSLYSGVAIFVSGKVVDAVVYSFDYSKAVMIISEQHEAIARAIIEDLDRGATYLNGEGTYSHKEKKVIFTVVKKQQLAELKEVVTGIDPNAFVVVQEAHQVLGEGFARYSKDAL